MKYRRIFLIVMDSLGIGNDKRSKEYGDEGSNTLGHIDAQYPLNIPTLASLGFSDYSLSNYEPINHPHSFSMRLNEKSNGKDTLTGHWEMMGVYTIKPFKTFTDTGFPKELIEEIEEKTGHKVIGNVAASGTEIIKELGERQMKENSLIVYTSSDSVLQIAAHEEVTGLEELYRVCEITRNICMKEEYKVARIIARPFVGKDKDSFKRTPNRHDYALSPSIDTALDYLKNNNYETYAVGKINDIFATKGISHAIKTTSNSDGMDKTTSLLKEYDKEGLYFVNLVEFDSEYGHRRNVLGYSKAIETFDKELSLFISQMKDDDLLLITADHGNDPTWKGSDHTREQVPLIIYSKNIKNGKYLNERQSFADIGATILYNFNIEKPSQLLGEVIKEVF